MDQDTPSSCPTSSCPTSSCPTSSCTAGTPSVAAVTSANSSVPHSADASLGVIPTAPDASVTVPVTPLDDRIEIEQFGKVKLRVARIESAEAVPKSKKLLKLQVDCGPEIGKRQIVSGISQFYTPESLIGKKIIIVANLKPAQLMGVESQGMLLAASSSDGTKLTIVDPGDMEPGSVVR